MEFTRILKTADVTCIYLIFSFLLVRTTFSDFAMSVLCAIISSSYNFLLYFCVEDVHAKQCNPFLIFTKTKIVSWVA